MVDVTKEQLLQEIESLRQQHMHAVNVAQQALGAISAYQSLIAQLDGTTEAGPALTANGLLEGIERGAQAVSRKNGGDKAPA